MGFSVIWLQSRQKAADLGSRAVLGSIASVNLVRARLGDPSTGKIRKRTMSFARNVHFTVRNGKVDEFNRLMNSEILPLVKKEKGFCQDLTLLNGNIGMSTSVWDDRTCAETYNTKTYPEVLQKLNPVLEGTPRVDTYDTIITTTPKLVHA